MPYKVATTIDLHAALNKECPILLCVPKSDVPPLSEVFNDENISEKTLQMKNVNTWVKEHRKGNHAVIEPLGWQEFEDNLRQISARGLAGKLDIAYEERVISAHNAFMSFGRDNILDDNWGNGSGAYVLYEDQKRRVGMARLFNEEGHVHIKIPFRESGQTQVSWNDITPALKKPAEPPPEFSHAGYIARAYERD